MTQSSVGVYVGILECDDALLSLLQCVYRHIRTSLMEINSRMSEYYYIFIYHLVNHDTWFHLVLTFIYAH